MFYQKSQFIRKNAISFLFFGSNDCCIEVRCSYFRVPDSIRELSLNNFQVAVLTEADARDAFRDEGPEEALLRATHCDHEPLEDTDRVPIGSVQMLQMFAM